MNKKVNTVLFILGATVFNIVTIVAIWIVIQLLLRIVVGLLIGDGQMLGALVIPSFILAMVGNFFLYRFVIKKLDQKFQLSQYLEPLFFKRNR